MSKELDIETLTRPGGFVPVNIETTAGLVREVLRLRKGIQDYLDGNYVNPRKYRNIAGGDGKCAHGRYWYEDCGECTDYHFADLLTTRAISNGKCASG